METVRQELEQQGRTEAEIEAVARAMWEMGEDIDQPARPVATPAQLQAIEARNARQVAESLYGWEA